MPRIIGGLLVLIAVAWWLHRRKQTGKGPSAIAENPDLWDSMTEHFEGLDRELAQARHWSEDEVALAIEQYVFKLEHSSEDDDDLVRKLSQQPNKTENQVLRVLGDPNMQTRLRKEPRDEPALYRACQLLLAQPTSKAVPFVRRLLAAASDPVRIDAFQWLAQACDDTAVGELAQGLNDADERVPAAIVTGLATGSHPAKSAVANALFEPLASLIAQAPAHITEQATTILLSWNREQVITRFEQEGILQPGHAAFVEVMTAIQASGDLLPRERLLQMLRQHDLTLATEADATALLRMLAGCHQEEDRSMLLALLEQSGPVAGAAATALLTAHNLEGWVGAILNESSRERSEPEQQAFAIRLLDSDLRNGGFQQYFANPSSSHRQDALAGLREADDNDRHQLLTEAIERSEANANAFGDLDTRYQDLTRPLQVTITRLILANPQAFRS